MSKNAAIDIFLRVRPTKKPSSYLKLEKDSNKCQFTIPKDASQGIVNNTLEKHSYEFNNVYGGDATQQEIFDKIAKEVVESAIEGYNGTIFAYGQTGSGKTFTMTGGPEKYQDRGIIPRTISYIFDQQKKRTELLLNVSISYIEIYNNDGYDLLDENHTTKNLCDLPKVIPRETQNEEIILSGLSVHKATTEEDALNLLFIGDTNRVVSETPKNDASTRSHCIFIVMIEGRRPNSDVKTISRLHLVDLSGSERIGKTGVDGLLQKEARFINLSLHFLEHVIVCLNKRANGENIHIPYRNSLMTLVLRDSLGGNCKTRMVATVSQEEGDLDESISTCRFAGRVALIKNSVTKNEAVDPSVIIERLKRENQQLKAEIAMLRGGESNFIQKYILSVPKENLEVYEIDECRKKVEEFLDSTDPSATIILNDRLKLNECFYHFKHLFKDQEKKISKQPLQQQSQPTKQVDVVNDQKSQEETKRLKLLVSQRDNEIMILLSLIEKYKKLGIQPDQQHVVVQPQESQQDEKEELLKSMVGHQSKLMTFPLYQEELEKDKIQEENQIIQQPQKQVIKVVQGGLDGPAKSLKQSTQSTGLEQSSSKEVNEVNSFLFQPLSLTNEQLLDRNTSFEMFRKSYRKNQAMEENKEILKEKFQRGKELGQTVNSSRQVINNLKNQIEELRKEKALLGLVNQEDKDKDVQEERLTLQIEHQKKIYKESFDELKELKSEIERIQHLLEKNRERMQKDFEQWLNVMMQQRSFVKNNSQDNSKISNFNLKVSDKDLEKKLQSFYKNKEIINQS